MAQVFVLKYIKIIHWKRCRAPLRMDGVGGASPAEKIYSAKERIATAFGAARPKRVHARLRALASLSFELGASRGGHFFLPPVEIQWPPCAALFMPGPSAIRFFNARRYACSNSRSLTRLVSNLERVMATSGEDAEPISPIWLGPFDLIGIYGDLLLGISCDC